MNANNRLFNSLLSLTFAFALVLLPTQLQARVRGAPSGASYLNGCGTVSATQTWCVGTDGWTVFSGTVGTSGTACNTGTGSTWNGTCVVSVSNTGNDTTCKAEPLTAGITSATLASFTPLLPCATLSAAQALLRNNQPDWMLLRRGDSWDGGLNGTTNGTITKSGLSADKPMLISAYGSGARPKIVKRQTSTNLYPVMANSTNGRYWAIVGIELYNAIADPDASDFLGAIVTGDTTSGSNTITNVSVPTWVQNGYNGSGYFVYGSGLNALTATWSAGAPNTLSLSGNAGFTATGLKFQIVTKDTASGIAFNQNANLIIVEDVYFNYSGLVFNQNVNQPLPTVAFNIRRNFFKTPWPAGGVFIGSLSTTPTNDQYILIEENVMDQGGAHISTVNWGGVNTTLLHCYYLHDPGPLYIFQRNIFSNCSASAHQMREGATFYNNLSIANPQAFSFQMVQYPTTASYNVADHATDLRMGFRLATADAPAGSTSISYDGQYGRAGALVSNQNTIVNLSNPGSLPEYSIQGVTQSTLSANTTASPISVSLTFPSPYTSVQAGIRGDGVKTGDLLQITCCGYTRGFDVAAGGGIYVDSGPNSTQYPAGSTVSIASGSPAVVTDTVGRGTDEIFQFTSGSPPAGTSLSTDYCTTNVNNTSKTYNYYPATAGTCPGVAANQVNAGSSAASIGRQGSRKFTFSTPFIINFQQTPIPAWVSVGTSVCQLTRNAPPNQNGFSGTNGCTTVSWISSDRLSMFTADPVATQFQGAGASVLIFDLPNANGHNQGFRFGPNNLMVNAAPVSNFNIGPVINPTVYSSYFDVSGNYIYNWATSSPSTANIVNTVSPWAGTNTTTQYSNVAGSTSYPWASVDAYDATLQNNTFTGTLSDNSNGGSYLDVTGGGGPSVGDILFAADRGNSVTQYMKVTSQVSSTRWITNKVQTLGPISMISGSYTHFVNTALLNSKGSYDTRYTANAANNFIRSALKCGDQTAYPGSASCPGQ